MRINTWDNVLNPIYFSNYLNNTKSNRLRNVLLLFLNNPTIYTSKSFNNNIK
jgi:hypothetical protein